MQFISMVLSLLLRIATWVCVTPSSLSVGRGWVRAHRRWSRTSESWAKLMTFLANYSYVISLYSHGLWPTELCCCRTVCVSFGENIVQIRQHCSKTCSWSEGSQHGKHVRSGHFTCFLTHERHWTKARACWQRQWNSVCNEVARRNFQVCLIGDTASTQRRNETAVTAKPQHNAVYKAATSLYTPRYSVFTHRSLTCRTL